MILAIDIGNTVIKCGVFSAGRLLRVYTAETRQYCAGKPLPWIRQVARECTGIIACSVVPAVNARLRKDFYAQCGCRVQFIGKDVCLSYKSQYKKTSLGADRSVNVYGSLLFYGAPTLIIDAGTALKIEYVNEKGIYEGGHIIPGLMTAIGSLAKETALLPRITTLKKPHSVWGKEAKECILSGVIYGYAALIDHTIQKMRRKHTMTVILIGGNALFLKPYITESILSKPNHTLESLSMISEVKLLF